MCDEKTVHIGNGFRFVTPCGYSGIWQQLISDNVVKLLFQVEQQLSELGGLYWQLSVQLINHIVISRSILIYVTGKVNIFPLIAFAMWSGFCKWLFCVKYDLVLLHRTINVFSYPPFSDAAFVLKLRAVLGMGIPLDFWQTYCGLMRSLLHGSLKFLLTS